MTLVQPADGSSTSAAQPTFLGSAGTAQGDSSLVTTRIYAGAAATGTPVQTLTATQAVGAWSVASGSPLAAGTYTARAEQPDTAGNVGAFLGSRSVSPPRAAGDGLRPGGHGRGPAGYWRLGEASGLTAASETAASRHVPGRSAAREAGNHRRGSDGAVALDGVNDNVRVPRATARSSAALSLETWVRPSPLPSGTATLLRKDSQYLVRLDAPGGVIFRVWKGGSIRELTTA